VDQRLGIVHLRGHTRRGKQFGVAAAVVAQRVLARNRDIRRRRAPVPIVLRPKHLRPPRGRGVRAPVGNLPTPLPRPPRPRGCAHRRRRCRGRRPTIRHRAGRRPPAARPRRPSAAGTPGSGSGPQVRRWCAPRCARRDEPAGAPSRGTVAGTPRHLHRLSTETEPPPVPSAGWRLGIFGRRASPRQRMWGHRMHTREPGVSGRPPRSSAPSSSSQRYGCRPAPNSPASSRCSPL